jgi:hypothetical protein
MNYLKMLGLAAVMAVALLSFAGAASANPLTSPEGTGYTSTLKAESEGTTKLHFSSYTEECSSSFEGKVESHTATTAAGALSSLSFSGCTYPITVLNTGTLDIHSTGSGTATVTSTGTEISMETPGGTCVFTTNATDIGTLTDTSITKGNATIDLNSAKIPRTGGNFLCGEFGTWTGSYKITTPSTLYADA